MASNPSADSGSRVAYLGPAGTFTEQAARSQPDLASAELTPYPSMADVLFAVHDGEADLGVVPIENAIEGTVNATIDTLAFDVDVLIQRELVEPVSLHLLTQPGATLSGITEVRSIPVATAQCRDWLRANLGEVAYRAANSTADAAATAADTGDVSVAAIANHRAAEVYGLEIAAEDIESHPENRTRFVLVAPDGIPAPTGHDKTSIVVYQQADRPGSLLSILQEFAARSINLTLLLSRPTKTSLGDYCFLLELDGHLADEVVADCLRSLKATQADVKFLGSYPAAGSSAPSVRQSATAAQLDAAEWVDAIRRMVH
ncbi:MAG: prephenate dehydratase [Actinomycetota bacterium]